MIRVKICGNRTIEEAFMSVRAGADAVGLIIGALYKTEDEIDVCTATEILASLPPYISTVLVTHLLSADEVVKIHESVPTTVIQLQNDIVPSEAH
jgi:phosphoribosylanthranilate isomerase